jgi:hypothetical protein
VDLFGQGGAVRELLGHADRVTTPLVGEEGPGDAGAGHGEQPQLAVAGPAAEEAEHRRGVGAGAPLGRGHGPPLAPSPDAVVLLNPNGRLGRLNG